MKQDEFLDRAIDQVARELTGGAPRHGFAGRVRRRTETSSPVARWAWQIAVGAAAATALIVWLALPARTITPVNSPARRTADRVLPAPSSRGALPPVTEARRQPEPLSAPARTLSTVWIPIETEDAPQIAAMPDIEDLTLPAINIAELNIPSLEPDKESR